jgi:hypothetical protein
LSNSKILNLPDETKCFADHVSMKAFQINNSRPILFNTDLKYIIYKQSLITNRIIGEINSSAYYITPVFNQDFIFFKY